jgi:NADH-quinone oxidoreductase subunit H
MYIAFTETTFWITLILIAAIMGAIQGTCAYMILAERKISAWTQDRIGPNRVGPWGLLQPIADGIKFVLKEQVVPGGVDKLFYFLGPAAALSTALLAMAVVPVGRTSPVPTLLDRRTPDLVAKSSKPMSPEDRAALLEENTEFSETHNGTLWPTTETEKAYVLAADRAYAKAKGKQSYEERLKEYNETIQFVIAPHLDIGIVFVFAVGSLAVYAIVLGGWSSNNKYSLLGSLRSSAQLISYEIPMGMAVLGVFIVSGSLNVEKIIAHQTTAGWNFFFQPVACLLFVTAIFAECNRVPFDLPECEQELVGGYHTEYSGMKFALFFLGEYTAMLYTSFLVIALFFGGWDLPYVTVPNGTGLGDMILKVVVFAGKMVLFVIFYMLIRWTIPRFRFDQLMSLAWKVMMPLALLCMLIVLLVKHYVLPTWLMPVGSLTVLVVMTLVSLRMPRAPTRSKLVVRGHPVTGDRVLMN